MNILYYIVEKGWRQIQVSLSLNFKDTIQYWKPWRWQVPVHPGQVPVHPGQEPDPPEIFFSRYKFFLVPQNSNFWYKKRLWKNFFEKLSISHVFTVFVKFSFSGVSGTCPGWTGSWPPLKLGGVRNLSRVVRNLTPLKTWVVRNQSRVVRNQYRIVRNQSRLVRIVHQQPSQGGYEPDHSRVSSTPWDMVSKQSIKTNSHISWINMHLCNCWLLLTLQEAGGTLNTCTEEKLHFWHLFVIQMTRKNLTFPKYLWQCLPYSFGV